MARGVSLLVRFIVADIAVKSVSFQIVAFYAPNDREEHVSFLAQFRLLLVDSLHLVLLGDRNTILDTKIDTGRGANGKSDDRSLVDLIREFGFIDSYRDGKMWTKVCSRPSALSFQ